MKNKSIYIEYIKEFEISIASTLVIILVIILVFNILIPNFNRANEIYSQSIEYKKKLDSLSHKYNLMTALDYKMYKDNFAKLNQVLPENKDYVSLITTFDAMEKQLDIKILRSDFKLGVISNNSTNSIQSPESNAQVIPVNIEVLGSLEDIKKALDTIMNFTGRFMIFDEMSAEVKSYGNLDVTFTGRAFYYPLPTTLGTVETPLLAMSKEQEAILKNINSLPISSAPEIIELDKNSVGKTNLFE